MRYLALACDYDGTLAHHGKVDEPTSDGLRRVRASGRRVLLVTGRELDELQTVCPYLDLFDLVVAENGGLLYNPATREQRPLAPPPSEKFVDLLRARGVQPMSVGRTIVATWEPHETTVLQTIRDLGLELQVIFNKGAVMILPASVNKATGLAEALAELDLSPHNVVGVGDAENDHAFLALCECSAAVANALPMLKERVDLVTAGDHGKGVVELIDELLAGDLRRRRLPRHDLLLGHKLDDSEVRIPSHGSNLLVAGPSGSGKSTVATGLLERLADAGYQFCVIDPEGDYQGLDVAVVLGTPRSVPVVEEALQLLRRPEQNVVLNLLGVPLADRPRFFAGLLPRLQELRAESGRPHWLLIDEAHHLLPAGREPTSVALPTQLESSLLVTVHPESVSPAVLDRIDTVLAVGADPGATLAKFAAAVREPAPAGAPARLENGEVLAWVREPVAQAPFRLRPTPGQLERRRHKRKYAEGELPPDRSFYFRGPEGKLNLRCHNLALFLELAAGVDDDTWLYHLRRRDYSHWLRRDIKDRTLAAEVERVERQPGLSAAESRARVRQAVERYYTLSASGPA